MYPFMGLIIDLSENNKSFPITCRHQRGITPKRGHLAPFARSWLSRHHGDGRALLQGRFLPRDQSVRASAPTTAPAAPDRDRTSGAACAPGCGCAVPRATTSASRQRGTCASQPWLQCELSALCPIAALFGPRHRIFSGRHHSGRPPLCLLLQRRALFPDATALAAP